MALTMRPRHVAVLPRCRASASRILGSTLDIVVQLRTPVIKSSRTRMNLLVHMHRRSTNRG
jgi:hypothetical protein